MLLAQCLSTNGHCPPSPRPPFDASPPPPLASSPLAMPPSEPPCEPDPPSLPPPELPPWVAPLLAPLPEPVEAPLDAAASLAAVPGEPVPDPVPPASFPVLASLTLQAASGTAAMIASHDGRRRGVLRAPATQNAGATGGRGVSRRVVGCMAIVLARGDTRRQGAAHDTFGQSAGRESLPWSLWPEPVRAW